jgi:hypothetical protein
MSSAKLHGCHALCATLGAEPDSAPQKSTWRKLLAEKAADCGEIAATLLDARINGCFCLTGKALSGPPTALRTNRMIARADGLTTGPEVS